MGTGARCWIYFSTFYLVDISVWQKKEYTMYSGFIFQQMYKYDIDNMQRARLKATASKSSSTHDQFAVKKVPILLTLKSRKVRNTNSEGENRRGFAQGRANVRPNSAKGVGCDVHSGGSRRRL